MSYITDQFVITFISRTHGNFAVNVREIVYNSVWNNVRRNVIINVSGIGGIVKDNVMSNFSYDGRSWSVSDEELNQVYGKVTS